MTESMPSSAPAPASAPTAAVNDYKYPSQRCTPEELAENHKNNVLYPEEISLDGFKFNAKVKPPVEGNPIQTAYFTHKDMPFKDEETDERLGMHLILPKMYVQYLGNKLDPTTGGERGWKMILQPSSAEYWKQGNDHYNLVQFLEGLDEKVIEAGYEHRKAWFPQEENLDSKADAKKMYKAPLAAYGPVENYKEPKYSNSWVDDEGQVITDYKNYTGNKHRKYAPKIYLPLPFGGHKEDKVGADGKTRKAYVKGTQLECVFLDGYTGKEMDISAEELPEWFAANKDGLQAQGIATLKCIQFPEGRFKLKMVATQMIFYTRSGRPALSTRALPSGIGSSMHRDAASASPVNEQSTVVKDEPSPKEEKEKEAKEEETTEPSKADAAATPDLHLNKKEETNIDSQKAYLASMKRNAVVETDLAAAATANPLPPFKESPRKKPKVSHAK